MKIAVWAGGESSAVSSSRLGVIDAVIAADSGLAAALDYGADVDVALGDFDSVDLDLLAAAEARGTVAHRHPPAKDATDLELAIDHALSMGATEVVVVGGAGGRLDHLVGNIALLTRDSYAKVQMSALCGPATVTVIRDTASLMGERGALVSLIPFGGPVRGITTTGLLYPLKQEALDSGSTRGVSNEMLSSSASVTVGDGVLVAVQPGAVGDHVINGIGFG